MKTSLCIAALIAAGTLSANTLWVDNALGDYTAHDGSPEELAFETIQEAVNAAAAGDTIRVKPGVYDKGETRDTFTTGKNLSRVLILKPLTIVSTGGAEVTHIVGASDPESTIDGLGDNAVRCVTTSEGAAGTVMRGFTLRDGRSRYDNNANSFATHSGGFAGGSWQTSYLIDCVVSNCVATRGGAVRSTTLIRTRLTHNRATNNGGAAGRFCNAYACILAHNGDGIDGVSRAALADSTHIVNCTFVGNGNGSIFIEGDDKTQVHNCVAIMEGNNTANSCSVYITESLGATPPALSHLVYGGGITDQSGRIATFAEALTDVAGHPWDTLVSPFEEDFRVVLGGPCDRTGDPALATPDWVPEEERGLDFYGEPLIDKNGKVNVGAVSGRAKVEANAGIHFFQGSVTYDIDGFTKASRYGERMYIRGTDKPSQIRLYETKRGDPIFNVTQTGAWVWSRYLDLKRQLWMNLPPKGSVVTNTIIRATATRYANPVTGSDAYDGTSPEVGENGVGPKRTLQAAVDSIYSGTFGIVEAAEGVYDEGEYSGGGWTNRVQMLNRKILLRGAGAGKSIIKGRCDTTDPDEHGCGPNAVRCVYAKSDGWTCVIGFTLADGCTMGGENVRPDSPYEGGAFYSNAFGHRNQLIDCVITNCAGSRGGVMFGGWAQRCRFAGNNLCKKASESYRQLALTACVIQDGNAARGGYATIANDGRVLVNLTFAGNMNRPDTTKEKNSQIDPKSAVVMNCVVDGDQQWGLDATLSHGLGNFESYGSNRNGFTYAADLLLADRAARDLRPRADSPLVGGGSVGDGFIGTNGMSTTSWYTLAQWYAMVTSTDIDGNTYLYVDGKPVAGAYQRPTGVVSVTARASGEIDNVGAHPLAEGETLTVTASGDARRKFLGFFVDGEFVASTEKTYTYTMPEGIHAAPVALSAAYNTNWYVNVESGSDANDGWTSATAKKTLVGAMEGPVAGDTVHAAKGVYKEGTAKDGSASTTLCRVNVPEGVTLAGDDRDETIIEGYSSNGGLCNDAVRGVYLAQNAVLRNLTVRKGYTKNGTNTAESQGAGVLGADDTKCLVEDCTIRDCRGSRSGAGQEVTFNRCRLIDNSGASTGAAGRCCSFYNTYISGCRGNVRALQQTTYFINSTYDTDSQAAATERDLFGDGGATVANAAFLVPNSILASGVSRLSNCVFVTGSGVVKTGITASGITTNSLEEIALDETTREPKEESVLVDAGAAALPAAFAETDCNGGQRIYNGAVDIGCFEHDWRTRYGHDIGVTVLSAPPEAVSREGGVYLPFGEITAVWNGDAGTVRVLAEATGSGALEMYVDAGETPENVWKADSAELFRWREATTGATLRFHYENGEEDAGGGLIRSFLRRSSAFILR